MPFDGAPFDRLKTFFKEYADADKTLAGESLKAIHKITLIAIIADDMNRTNCKENSLKLHLKTLPVSLKIRLLESITPACKSCRECFNGYQKFESIGNCSIDKYLFWMKTETTLSTSTKACKTRLKYHTTMFMSGIHKEDFEKEADQRMAIEEQLLEKELEDYQILEDLNDIYECIGFLFE